jgi:hypothetical protein
MQKKTINLIFEGVKNMDSKNVFRQNDKHKDK